MGKGGSSLPRDFKKTKYRSSNIKIYLKFLFFRLNLDDLAQNLQ
jgi:hypothetical protein